MKRSLIILLSILSLSIFFNIEKDHGRSHGYAKLNYSSVEDLEQSFSQGDNYIDLNGRRGSSSTVSVSKIVTKGASSRRSSLNFLSGVKIAIAYLHSECGYSYSCDFPFEHQPQRKLFFILRNIRI
ncbi:MAG: hypothetical protein SNG38_07500 [Rikenellaceae bacterium]